MVSLQLASRVKLQILYLINWHNEMTWNEIMTTELGVGNLKYIFRPRGKSKGLSAAAFHNVFDMVNLEPALFALILEVLILRGIWN
jgi:hypothetical protein